MQFTAANKAGARSGPTSVEEVVRQIARLVRHPAYRRGLVVSPLLLRHLPADAGYAWQGEATLRARLIAARLDSASLDHLLGSVRSEMAQLRGPA